MSFDWSQYYNLAQELAGRRTTEPISQEARLRAAMSRAYYAAHWIVRQYLKDKHNFTPQKGYEHGDIWRELYKGGPEYPDNYIKVGSWLESLYDYRRKADYESNFPQNLNTSAQLALQLARKIISAIEEFKKQP